MLYNIMPENLYPQLPTVPTISQGSFNIEMVTKCYQDIANIKEKYTEKQRRYKNACNRLLHASTGASSVALVSGVSTIQGWISDMGIDGPTFVPKSGYFLLIWVKVCPQKLAFS